MKKVWIAVLLVTAQLTSFAQGGELDNSFGTEGKVITPVNMDDDGNSMVIQPDGKIIVGGSTELEENIEFVLVRYNVDGSLDDTFGEGGIVQQSFGGDDDICQKVLLTDDGKILALGFTLTFGEVDNVDFALARFNSDGTLDDSFGVDGLVITNTGDVEIQDGAFAGILQEDGKILALGIQIDEDLEIFNPLLLRYNTDGTLDETLDGDGILVVGDDFSNDDEGMQVVVDPTGKIIVGGTFYDTDLDLLNFSVSRFNIDGSVDASFGTDGSVISNIGEIAWEDEETNDSFSDITLMADGKIVVAGTSDLDTTAKYFTLMRYNADGSVDETFGTDGVTLREVSFGSNATAIAVQADNKILLTGDVPSGIGKEFILIRYTVDGLSDVTFGTDGVVFTNFGDFEDLANEISITPTGKIVVAGETSVTFGNNDLAVAQYHPEALDIGIEEDVIFTAELAVFPNPIAQTFNVSYTLKNKALVSFELFDITGKRVALLMNNESRANGLRIEQFDLSNTLSPGFYQLVLTTDETRQTIQIIVQ